MDEPIKRAMPGWRKPALAFWLSLWPLWAALHLYPIRNGDSRAGLVAAPIFIVAGALLLFWRTRAGRFSIGAGAVLVAAIFTAPGHHTDARTLRAQYVGALRSYADTPYVWGGETHRGIDCSGLPRAALVDANLRQGLQSLNTRLLRRAFEIWWHDSSALALRDGYRGWTENLFAAASLNELDYGRLLPGDLATTSGGNHCLAYIGDKTWIEADPSALVGDKVIIVTVPSKNPWFSQPMQLLRWRQFADIP